MSQPMTEPDHDLAALFAAERSRPGPPQHVEDRVHAAVVASIAVGVVAGSALAAGTASAASAASVTASPAVGAAVTGTGTGLWASLLAIAKPAAVVVAAATATATAGYVVSRAEVTPAVVATDAPAPPMMTPPVMPTPIPVIPVVAKPVPPPERTRTVVAPAVAESTADDAALAAQRVVLARAKASLAAGDPGGALMALADLQGAQLREERDALVIFALADAGRQAEAGAKLKGFSQRYPRSLFRSRLEQRLSQPADPTE